MQNTGLDQHKLQKMKDKKRLALTPMQRVERYSPALFFLIPIFIFSFELVKFHIINGGQGEPPRDNLIGLIILFTFITLVIFAFRWWNLRFRETPVDFKEYEFQAAVRRAAENRNWKIKCNEDKYLIAYRENDQWAFEGSQLITIIKDQNSLLINSICDPSSYNQISLGGNQRNINAFINNLNDVKNGVPINPTWLLGYIKY